MKQAMLYVHGKGGSAQEAQRYRGLCAGYDVFGAEYDGSFPSVASAQIRESYDDLKRKYDNISLLANSIGAYFSMLALQDRALRKAYFISPILDMERLICDMMQWANVSEEQLREKEQIPTDFGETLSWSYLCYVREHLVKWDIPTAILYAQCDHLTKRSTVESFASSHDARLTVMQDGEHWFHTKEQLAFLDAWLQAELRDDRSK